MPFPSPGDLPDPGVEPGSPALQADSFQTELQRVAGGLINGQVHPLRAVGRQRARAPPGGAGGNGRSHPPPSFCVLAHCSLALGQRDRCVQTDRGEKGPPQSQPSWTPSGCGDELERLMGADSKEACLFKDLELLYECGGGRVVVGGGGGGGGVSMKGWSRWVSCVDRRVSCVDSSVGVLSGQTPRSDDAGGRGLVMWG